MGNALGNSSELSRKGGGATRVRTSHHFLRGDDNESTQPYARSADWEHSLVNLDVDAAYGRQAIAGWGYRRRNSTRTAYSVAPSPFMGVVLRDSIRSLADHLQGAL